MATQATQRWSQARIPVRSLRLEVLDGPDKGRQLRAEAETVGVGTAVDNALALADPTVSRYHAELTRLPDGILVVDQGSTNGTVANGVRIHNATLAPGSEVWFGRSLVRVTDGEDVVVRLYESSQLAGLHGRTPVMRRLMAQVERAADSDASVLVIGESGTGKELIARALHSLGPRASRPFVTLDCASLTPSLVASELFGHERGAFTGATQTHMGAFERADGGTLLLDEIGDLPTEMQATLLGVLERRRFQRLGGHEERPFAARVIGATHHDLRRDVNAGIFRLDLYYRLAVVTLRVPPLREHSDDVPLLVEHFLRLHGHAQPIESTFSVATLDALCARPWPGNVRELRNFVGAVLAMGEVPEDDTTLRSSGGLHEPTDQREISLDVSYRDARARSLLEFEARFLDRLMQAAGNNISQAARLAQMDRSHLSELLSRHRQMRVGRGGG
ncbi:MAG: sigma 54-interacting transcriptional regulator [Myxococcota bacterium]